MKSLTVSRRKALKLLGAAAGAAAVPNGFNVAKAAAPVQLLGWRYPSMNYFAEKLQRAIPDTTVNTQLLPADKAMELTAINLSSKSANLDILTANNSSLMNYAKSGWLRPLDDLWEKYKDQYNLADFEHLSAGYEYNGHKYILPLELNSLLLFYRTDLLQEAGKGIPQSLDEYKQLAKTFNTSQRAGTTMLMRVGDPCASEAAWYINNIGDGWFNDKWQPVINSPRGVAAIEYMKEVSQYAQRGFANAAGDEGTLALCQGFASMGNMWASRCKTVNNPASSKFAGKFAFAAPPQGKQRLTVAGYAISAYSKQDPDLLFRLMLEASTRDSMKGIVMDNVPPRSVLLDDAELVKTYPYLAAAKKAAADGSYFPKLPQFYPVAELMTRRIVQAVTGEMPVKAAMDAAAEEATKYLRDQGVYQ